MNYITATKKPIVLKKEERDIERPILEGELRFSQNRIKKTNTTWIEITNTRGESIQYNPAIEKIPPFLYLIQKTLPQEIFITKNQFLEEDSFEDENEMEDEGMTKHIYYKDWFSS
jgi:hypothetical protein